MICESSCICPLGAATLALKVDGKSLSFKNMASRVLYQVSRDGFFEVSTIKIAFNLLINVQVCTSNMRQLCLNLLYCKGLFISGSISAR